MDLNAPAMPVKNKRWILPAVCFVVVHAYLLLGKGVQEFYDSAFYIKSADYFVEHGNLQENYQIFYIITIACVGFFRFVFGDNLLPFVVFQIGLYAAALICLFKATSKLFQSSNAGVITVLIMIFWIDNVRWNTAIMTESIFCSLVCFALYAAAAFRFTLRSILTLASANLMVVFCRPTGVLVTLGIMVFILLRHRVQWRQNRFMMLVMSTGFMLVAGWVGYTMFSIWDFTDQYKKGNIVTYADIIAGSELDHNALRCDAEELRMPDTTLHPIQKMILFFWYNPVNFLKGFGMKIFYLLSATRPYYSFVHNMFSFIWMTALYGTAWFGFKVSTNTPLVIAMLAVFIINCILVGISTVDWDNRFLIPAAPGMAVLAGGGSVYLIRRWRRIERNGIQ